MTVLFLINARSGSHKIPEASEILIALVPSEGWEVDIQRYTFIRKFHYIEVDAKIGLVL
jgi:hypothetical protein